LFARCLILLNDINRAYFYEAIGTTSITGSLSHLLCVTDEQLMSIYRYCGFYNVKRNCFCDTILQGFIEGLDAPIGSSRHKNPTTKIHSLLIKIDQGSYPSKPLHQVKDQLQPPNHRLRKEERQLVASLLKLCCYTTTLTPSDTNTSAAPNIDVSLRSSATKTTNATNTMCQKFNIRTPRKAALVMELAREMKSLEKAPVRRQLLWRTIQSLNNKIKKFIHVPQCIDDASANTVLRKYKVVEQIVETVGGGAKSPEGLDVGALWIGKRLTETNRSEFATCSSRAGITVMAQMSPEATAAMRHDALVTKTKQQRKIARRLFDHCKRKGC
jgi:hypothetical protein